MRLSRDFDSESFHSARKQSRQWRVRNGERMLGSLKVSVRSLPTDALVRHGHNRAIQTPVRRLGAGYYSSNVLSDEKSTDSITVISMELRNKRGSPLDRVETNGVNHRRSLPRLVAGKRTAEK